MGVKQIQTGSEFSEALASAGSQLVVVDFYADWCGPCRMISPKFAEFSEEFKNVVFLKVNVDDNSEVTEKYGVNCMPTFLFFKNGEKVDTLEGASEARLKSMIVNHSG